MYATIEYDVATMDTKAILRDVLGLATGTVTSLSGINGTHIAENSFITTAIPGGWELWDDEIEDRNRFVIRAPVSDDATKFKYIQVMWSSNGIFWNNYSAWNNETHTGSVLTRRGGSSSYTSTIYANFIAYYIANQDDVTIKMLLNTSSNHFASMCMHGDGTELTAISFMSEHERGSPWDTIENGYIPILYNGAPHQASVWTVDNDSYNWCLNKPVVPSTSTVDYSISNNLECQATMSTPVGSGWYKTRTEDQKLKDLIAPSATTLDANKQPKGVFVPFGGMNPSGGLWASEITSKSNMWLYTDTVDSLRTNDIIVSGGQNYRIWEMTSNHPTGSRTSSAPLRFALLEA